MNSDEVIIQNYLEAKNFLLANNLMQHGIPINTIKAYVEYRLGDGRFKSGDATVSIFMDDVFHNGNVDIDGEAFNSNDVHIEFKTAWQHYKFDKVANKLVITGASPLMGNYIVKISPK